MEVENGIQLGTIAAAAALLCIRREQLGIRIIIKRRTSADNFDYFTMTNSFLMFRLAFTTSLF